MNKNKKIWIGIVSFILAAGLFGVLLAVELKAKQDTVYVTAVCAKSVVPENVRITQQNADQYLEERQIPDMCLPRKYFSDKTELYEKVSGITLSEGMILTEELFTEYEKYYETYEDLTWISVPVEQLYEGVAGRLRAGDYIDIYSLSKNDETQGFQCSLLAEGVRIEAAYSQQGVWIGESSQEGLSQLIVIPMEKERVAWFYEVLAQGSIRIAKYENV